MTITITITVIVTVTVTVAVTVTVPVTVTVTVTVTFTVTVAVTVTVTVTVTVAVTVAVAVAVAVAVTGTVTCDCDSDCYNDYNCYLALLRHRGRLAGGELLLEDQEAAVERVLGGTCDAPSVMSVADYHCLCVAADGIRGGLWERRDGNGGAQ